MYARHFVIAYPNGSITLNINNYFVKADLPSIKKVFKIAQQHCTEKHKSDLIKELENTKTYWQKKFENGKKRYSADITNILTPSTQKQLLKLHVKLDRIIEILQMENWRNESAFD